MTAPARPSSRQSDLARPYWEAAAEGRLLLQCCAACGKVRHYPRLLCDSCYSDAVDWKEASGRGTIHSWTVAHHAFHPAFAAELPYALVTVDLDEGAARWRCRSVNRCKAVSRPARVESIWCSRRGRTEGLATDQAGSSLHVGSIGTARQRMQIYTLKYETDTRQ